MSAPPLPAEIRIVPRRRARRRLLVLGAVALVVALAAFWPEHPYPAQAASVTHAAAAARPPVPHHEAARAAITVTDGKAVYACVPERKP